MTKHELLSTAGETIAYAEDYLDTRIELLKLQAAETGSKTVASVISVAVVALLGLTAMSLFSTALAIWLGYLVGSYPLGFVLLGTIYLAIAAVVFVFRDALLTQPILRGLVAKLFAPAPDAPQSLPHES